MRRNGIYLACFFDTFKETFKLNVLDIKQWLIIMSELSFQTFCIEFYSKHIQKPSPEVYALFARSGLLDMLKTDYDDLHGMGMEALMQFFDEYLAKELASPETMNAETIEHCQVRAINIPEIVKILC